MNLTWQKIQLDMCLFGWITICSKPKQKYKLNWKIKRTNWNWKKVYLILLFSFGLVGRKHGTQMHLCIWSHPNECSIPIAMELVYPVDPQMALPFSSLHHSNTRTHCISIYEEWYSCRLAPKAHGTRAHSVVPDSLPNNWHMYECVASPSWRTKHHISSHGRIADVLIVLVSLSTNNARTPVCARSSSRYFFPFYILLLWKKRFLLLPKSCGNSK